MPSIDEENPAMILCLLRRDEKAVGGPTETSHSIGHELSRLPTSKGDNKKAVGGVTATSHSILKRNQRIPNKGENPMNFVCYDKGEGTRPIRSNRNIKHTTTCKSKPLVNPRKRRFRSNKTLLEIVFKMHRIQQKHGLTRTIPPSEEALNLFRER